MTGPTTSLSTATSSALRGFLAATAAYGDRRPFGHYRITRTADGKAIGGIGFKGQPEDGRIEVGYGLAPSARGNGYAAEALAALLDPRDSTTDCPASSPRPPATTSPPGGPSSVPASGTPAPTMSSTSTR